jgi:sugar-phosphatase
MGAMGPLPQAGASSDAQDDPPNPKETFLIAWTCRAILFDLDGVLVDSRRSIELIWHEWAARRGLDPAPFLRVAHGRRTSETIRTVAPGLDMAAAVAELDAMEAVEARGLTPAPGAAALLAFLAPSEWAVVTSGGHAVATLRLRTSNLPVPGVFVTADDVARGKPDPEGYLLAASRLAVVPRDCIVVEDSPTGLAAARAAGMRTIAMLTTYEAGDLGEADARLPSLADLHLRRADAATGLAVDL